MAVAVQFFGGSDDYTSLTTLQAWKRAFVQKYNDASVVSIDGAANPETIRRDIQEATQAQSLFASATLVILRNVFEVSDDKVQAAVEELWAQAKPQELIVLNWQRGEPDKRRVLYKRAQKMVKEGKAVWQQFIEPKDYERATWADRYLAKKGGSIDREAKEYVLNCTREQPLWALASALDLLLVVADGEIGAELARRYVIPYMTTDNFGVTDYLVANNKQAALTAMVPLTLSRQPNMNELIGLFGAITWSIRSLLILKSLRERGVADQDLAKESGVNPYVVRKLLGVLPRLDINRLRRLLVRAAELDQKMKSGESEAVWAVEELVWSF